MRERAWSPSLPTARASVATRYPGSWWAGAAKLPVSQPEDSLEREADQFADLIMRTAGPSPQHQPASPGAPGLSDLAGRGQPLPNDVRSFFEPRFGHDFSSVRIHSDQRAADLAAEHDARAFTVKRDIVFGPGEYQPTTPAGRHLLAHELTHVVQQADSVGLQRQAIESSQASESELEIEGDREIDQVVGAFPLANRGSRLHGPPVAQRVCAKSVAEVGYPVRIDLHIPATPSPNRSQTTAQISAMANDDSGQTAGLTRFNARLVWAVGVGSRGGRSWITRIRVFFRIS